MGALRKILTAFLGGEIGPLLYGRVDTDQYAYGLQKCENFVCINEGPLVKRPGFAMVVDADATASWLSAFRYSVTQEYAIEWGELKARFYTNGGRIETAPGVPFEAVTPYAAADTPYLSTQQSFDRLYIDHAGYAPGALTRTGAATFVHNTTTLKNGPFLDPNSDTAVTVTAAGGFAVGGAVTFTASAAIFAASDVGSAFRVEAKDFSTIKAWQPGMDAIVVAEVVRSEGKAYEAETAGKTGTIVPTHTDGSEWDGQNKMDVLNAKGPYGVKWKYRHDRFGQITITAIGGGGTTATGTVTRRIPDSLATVASHRWALAAFSETRGWPGVVLHAFGRQIHLKDLDVIGSVVNDYGGGQCNFETLTSSGVTAPDLGFRRTLDASNPPLWGRADRSGLLVGTADGEIAIGPVNNAAAVAGDNIRATPQSSFGSEAVWPLALGTKLAMCERGGRRIRLIDFDFASDRYVPIDLTAGAQHITKGGVLQFAWQRVPHALLYAVRGDGQLVVHADTRLELKGLSRIVAGGAARVLSAVSIVGADGKSDELWALIERTRHDGVKREIWQQAAWRDLGDDEAEQFYVDAGVRVAAAGGQVHFTGLDHLSGQAVAVLAGGGVVPGLSVSATGELDLPAGSVPADPYVLVVGLPYTAEAVLLRPEAALRGSGTLQGLKKKVRKVIARVLETLGLRAGALEQAVDDMDEMIDRSAADAMDAAVPLFTGDTPGAIDMDFDLDGQVRLVSDVPLAATINALVLSMEVDEADG